MRNRETSTARFYGCFYRKTAGSCGRKAAAAMRMLPVLLILLLALTGCGTVSSAGAGRQKGSEPEMAVRTTEKGRKTNLIFQVA